MRKYLVAVLLGGMFAICAEHFLTIDDALNQKVQNPFFATVEAQSPIRFEVQKSEYIVPGDRFYNYKLTAVCDTATGTLLYSTGYQSGLWGVANGCAKTNR
ncbi:MAG: hypothetical protein A3B86_02875 [Candidatus Yanofskybacteria bacterium RIFCSPHIGHO2_02_FULL_38_22b]|uniref:Uncharacterized protein n=1 Tax=Candidatus Yanofskybacteria bacterium RIFCSPHIGHO2_02_FULL_38_22b TaxID=1802673 RepID=A0A1F8F3J7_9BACT|nr:MAG: hypothetical protein A3B86_02875 [Candidatus Yanofskybacteria bacterium RIFCSPHIGHO2_02_FULL_38_22b]OGN20711.1 MAG: hypothetical protein A2910_00835 [Candidatus Yanofskybacteria bacterium RIFCSPLOWO2_01_FULL_39_28]